LALDSREKGSIALRETQSEIIHCLHTVNIFKQLEKDTFFKARAFIGTVTSRENLQDKTAYCGSLKGYRLCDMSFLLRNKATDAKNRTTVEKESPVFAFNGSMNEN